MMASSSSIISPQTKYNVFLSFRGKDTCYGFTSHLYEALCKKKILTFIDDGLIRGDEISPALLSAIEGSKISIIIFSQSYASSRWCLEELVKILECKNMHGQIVIPVFYHVDPLQVRNQTGPFGDAFAKLEERFKEMLEKVQKWRSALTETTNLSGFDSNVIRSEAALVKEIVQDILKRLSKITASSDNENLVGIEASVKEIELLLKKDVSILGILGIGGAGKTTIARVVFNKISSQFEGIYFAENAREEFENRGLNHLRQQLLHAILEDEYVDIDCTITKERLGLMKLLIVLDDVTSPKQIEDLIKDPKILGFGSQIIKTTRDKQVLKNCEVDNIYEVRGLSHPEDLQLFTQYAFKLNRIPEDYMDLSYTVVYYSKGLPLALKVMGSSLLGKEKEVWTSAINKLQDAPPLDIYKVLKLSYDGLDSEQQDIFLDIACFFKGKDRDMVIKILKANGLEAEYEISILIDKSLITISSDKTITMHDLIEEMGKKIAREEKDFGKSSRLWHKMDIMDVLEKNMGTKMARGICLNMFKMGVIHLNPFAFLKMHNLIILKVYGDSKNKLRSLQGIEYDLLELKYICWDSYPWKSFPSSFNPKKVVALEMQYSKLEALWLGVQKLDNLKYMDLSYSMDLLKIPDLSLAPNLESVILIGCTSLLEITLSSTPENLNKLVILNLRDCKRLCSLPRIICKLKSLRHLTLSGCSNLKKVPKMPSQIEELYLDGLESLPEDISKLESLLYLSISNCSNFKLVPKLPCHIKELDLSGTAIKELFASSIENLSRLEILPSSIEHRESPESLRLKNYSTLESLPNGICMLNNLLYLSLFNRSILCADETAIREIPASIVCLNDLQQLSPTTDLDLSDTCVTELPNSFWKLSSLYYLNLGGNNFESIPASIINLTRLNHLDVSYCSRLQSLPELPSSLYRLEAQHCTSLQTLSWSSVLSSCGINLSACFFECSKLDKNALKNRMKFVLQHIKENIILGKKRRRVGDMCFLGSEIPECLNFQSNGSFIELPGGLFNNNIAGMALCIVLAFQDYDYKILPIWVECKLSLKCEDGNYKQVESHLFWDSINFGRTNYIPSDHVLLGFNFSMFNRELHKISQSSETKIIISFHDIGEWWKVKKCGVHLFYKEERKEPYNFFEGESSSRSGRIQSKCKFIQ